MIVVNGVIETSAQTIDAVKAAIATMETHSRAEAGCRDYTFSIELNNPDILRITEKWDNMEALAAHFQQPHMADFQAVMGQHPPKAMSVSFYEASEVDPPSL